MNNCKQLNKIFCSPEKLVYETRHFNTNKYYHVDREELIFYLLDIMWFVTYV